MTGFKNEGLSIPLPIGSNSTSIDDMANIQFNPLIDIINIPISILSDGKFMSDSTTSEKKFNKIDTSSAYTVSNHEVKINITGKYYHDCSIVVTLSNNTPSGASDLICEILNGSNLSYTDDTHFISTEISNGDSRYHTVHIKTLIDHNQNDIAKLRFNSNTLNDEIKIKQIKWIIMKYS
jgi:hypothetical protein